MGETIPMKKRSQSGGAPGKPLEQIADELESMLTTMTKSLVDHPADVVIGRAISPTGFIAFEVQCRHDEAGSLIGQRGSHADAIRTLLMAAAAARKVRVTVQIMSPGTR